MEIRNPTTKSCRDWKASLKNNRNILTMGFFKNTIMLFISASNFPFPIIGDEKRLLASKLGMLDPMNLDSTGAPLTVRAVSNKIFNF
jgi:hypothetical protein